MNAVESKDCPNGKIPKSNLVHKLMNDKNGTCAIREIISPQCSIRDIGVPKHLVANPIGPNKCWVPRYHDKLAELAGGKRCIEDKVRMLGNHV
jgi:hypothetical protein